MLSDTVLCVGYNNTRVNEAWATILSEILDSSTFMDKYGITSRQCNSAGTHHQATQRSKSKRNQTFLGPRNRVTSEAESMSCLCLGDIGEKKPGNEQHCQRLPNMHSNSGKVICVSVDLDRKECGTVRARTNQPDNGITSLGNNMDA